MSREFDKEGLAGKLGILPEAKHFINAFAVFDCVLFLDSIKENPYCDAAQHAP